MNTWATKKFKEVRDCDERKLYRATLPFAAAFYLFFYAYVLLN